MRPAVFALFAACSLFATGCVEGELTYYLNPDGSGKVDIDVVMPTMEGFSPSGPRTDDDASPKEQIAKLKKEFVNEILEDSDGISAWENVSAKIRKDGKLHFQGTAYFKDASKLDIEQIPALKPRLLKQDGKLKLTLHKNDDDDNDDDDDEDKLNPKKLSDGELGHYITLQRVKYQQMKGLMRAFLTDLDIKAVFKLPGKIQSVQGFEEQVKGTSSVTVRLHGKKILKELKRLTMLPDEKLKAHLKQNGDIVPTKVGGGPEALDKLSPLFGKLKNASVTIAKPDDPLFDYAAAVEKAKPEFETLKKKYDVDTRRKKKRKPADPAKNGDDEKDEVQDAKPGTVRYTPPEAVAPPKKSKKTERRKCK